MPVEVHYEIHLVYKAIFADQQTIGGVAAFVCRAPTNSDYVAFLRRYVEDKGIALIIHDQFFDETLDEEFGGRAYAQFLAKYGQRGADKLRNQLGEDGFKAHMIKMAKASHAKLKEELGEEGYKAKQGKGGKAAQAKLKKELGEEGYRKYRSKLSRKGGSVLHLSAPNLETQYSPGQSDRTDYLQYEQLGGRMESWKKTRKVTKEDANVKAFLDAIEPYREGRKRHAQFVYNAKKKK